MPSIISFRRGVAAMNRMDQVICRNPKINSTAPGLIKDNIDGDIELQGVSFAYPAHPEIMVLSNLNLKIASETTVALVGLTGSGKTTILQLLQRFYDPNIGRILIDGVDLREFQLQSIRQHIGLVNQEPILFSGTIKENIALGKLGCNINDVIQAAKFANIHDFISLLPEKYHTDIGSQGVLLSGGQKQRIAIARAMIKNPKILLLDEATTTLDNKSEKLVQTALNRLVEGRTTIVIAHRLSTIKDSNKIAVVKDGEIVEVGDHAELIQYPNGQYTSLVKIQMATIELDAEFDKEQEQPEFPIEEKRMSRRQSKSFARRVNDSLRRLAVNLGQNSAQKLTGYQSSEPTPYSSQQDIFEAMNDRRQSQDEKEDKEFNTYENELHTFARRQSLDITSRRQINSRRQSLDIGWGSGQIPIQNKLTESLRTFTNNWDLNSGANMVGFLPSQQTMAMQALATSQRQFRDVTSHRMSHDLPSHRQSLDLPSQQIIADSVSNGQFQNVTQRQTQNPVKLASIISQKKPNLPTTSTTTKLGGNKSVKGPKKFQPTTILENTSVILQTTSTIYKASYRDNGDSPVPENNDSYFTRLRKIQWQQVGATVMGIITSIVMGAPQPVEAFLLPRALESLMYNKSQFNCRQNVGACTCKQIEEIRQGEITQNEAADFTLWRYEWLNQTEIYCYIAIAGGFLFVAMIHNWSYTKLGINLSSQVQQLLFKRMLQQEIGFFDFPENSVGALSKRLQSDALLIRGALGESLGMIIQITASIIGCLLVGFLAGNSSWKVALVLLATTPIFIGVSYIRTKYLQSSKFELDEEIELANTIVFENIFNVRIVQSFVLENNVHERYASVLNHIVTTSNKKGIFDGGIHGVQNFFQFGVIALGVWYGGTLLGKDELNFQEFFQAFLAIVFVGNNISVSQIIFPEFAKARPAMARIFEIVDRKPLIDGETEKGYKLDNVKGQVDYREIYFGYPTRPEVQVLNNFSLNCEAEQITAIVGETGSGKSTTLTLLQRFYDPQQGQIFFDGINVKKLNLKWLRDQISLVTQEPVLFNESLIENLRIGRPDVTYKEATEACRNANIKEFVESLPQELDTQIGQKGIRLSAGQKQMIAIARAMLKNPRVLMLDEATRALDIDSEKIVQNALDTVSKNRTTIIIAHRMRTISQANKIAVVQRGKLVEEGTHQQLVRIPDGVYNGLLRASN